MNTKTILGLGVAALLIYGVAIAKNDPAKEKRIALKGWIEAVPAGEMTEAEKNRYIDIFINQMTAAEAAATHQYIFQYVLQEQTNLPPELYNQMQQIVNKYSIFNG